ncbi:MAG: penicillin-binding protein [Oscillospiraceae bacterium]|nr:penicillin-binding protein [Oscillospiraceae bacterium]
MNRVAGRAAVVLVLVAALVVGILFFTGEYIAKGDDWATFQGSPHVYNGSNIGCGAVTDRNGILLLDMTDGWDYSTDLSLRKSTIHWLGDRYGYISAPALSYYAQAMAGYDTFNGVYAYGDTAGIATLTISGQVQKAALEAMGNYKGTVAVYNYETGEILCAVSTPNYDPDNVPDIEGDTTGAYEGLYVNRFIQSSYIPGSIFKAVTVAAALETIPDIMERTFYCDSAYQIGADWVTCERAHGEVTLETAFEKSCNCAFAQLVEELGGETLEKYVAQFQITESLTFDGITTSEGNFDISSGEMVDIAWSGIGQHKDLVNPCRFMTYMGAIAGGGSCAEPYLVSEIRVGSSRTYSAKKSNSGRIMSEETAEMMQELMRNNVESNYGSENFPGLTVCAKSGTGEVGGDQKPNAMFCGFVTDAEYPLAFVVAIENGGYGSQVCVPIISQVLAACKQVMDIEG